ncbi:1-aminocyclopropane-1-carboxylate deaminase/D-cysteine desulfhydrase [Staphylospora marina]|uniref:1-aminocyclopropane-1-carboxylate deaminase/D-cysteine desulfhydrase n=1 Tax=Staphylospora marina TaxID=2490858 RepID=UPI0013DE6687|nr:D-cysteine desulfhydrase family protein [Staphylospora marina]
MKKETPRFPILTGETPLQPLRRFSEHAGAEIWIKRDDLTGIGVGGNKLRKLEFLLGEALDRGCDLVLTGGSPQSNHARLTAAAAAAAGLKARLLFAGRRTGPMQGNLLLDRILGAEVILTGKYGTKGLLEAMEEEAENARSAGLNPYVIPVGGSTPVGDWGYVLAWRELESQRERMGIPPFDEIVVALGTGGTLAGLWIGGFLDGSKTRLTGISVWETKERAIPELRGHAENLAAWIGVTPPPDESGVEVDDRFFGPKYGVPSEAGNAAIRLLARTEGIFADPVYTGKALAGMLERIRRGEMAGRRILFWHTGGLPAVFAHAASFEEDDGS